MLGSREHELEALRELAGGVTATHLRATPLRPEVFDAVVEGLADARSRVRWSVTGTWKITGTEQDGNIISVEMTNAAGKVSNVKWDASNAAGNPPQIVRLQPTSPTPFVRKS